MSGEPDVYRKLSTLFAMATLYSNYTTLLSRDLEQVIFSNLWELPVIPSSLWTNVSGFEKRAHFAEFLFLIAIAHNFKAVIATDLKPGRTILQSLHYTQCKFRAPPTSGSGVAIASTIRGRKSTVLCLPLVAHRFR